MIKILLVDDHDLVRMGIRRLIEDIEGFEVSGEVATGEAAIQFAANENVDVILMDLNMPGIGGMEATRRLVIKQPNLKIIALTMHDSEPFPQQLFKAGAMGYLTKGCHIDEIKHAVKEVYCGRRYVSIEIAQMMALKIQPGSDNPFDDLSQREMQVMMMIMQGMKSQQISDRLVLSPKTISTYRYRLFNKLDIKSDIELSQLARRYGLVE